MTITQVEFAVPMSCQSCADKVDHCLQGVEGVQNVHIDREHERVVIESSLPIFKLQTLLESTGKKVIIKGVGSKQFSSAVAVLSYPVGFTTSGVRGVVRFTQVEEDCVIDGTIDGLKPGPHGFHIHSGGDLSQGCDSIGDHYNPYNAPHGGPENDISQRHVGDLGNILADDKGRAQFRIIDKIVKLQDLIGRSVAVTAQQDDLGRGPPSTTTKVDGNSGKRLSCGIIARSAGVLQNSKKVCFCSGRTLWEEQEFVEAEARQSFD